MFFKGAFNVYLKVSRVKPSHSQVNWDLFIARWWMSHRALVTRQRERFVFTGCIIFVVSTMYVHVCCVKRSAPRWKQRLLATCIEAFSFAISATLFNDTGMPITTSSYPNLSTWAIWESSSVPWNRAACKPCLWWTGVINRHVRRT